MQGRLSFGQIAGVLFHRGFSGTNFDIFVPSRIVCSDSFNICYIFSHKATAVVVALVRP